MGRSRELSVYGAVTALSNAIRKHGIVRAAWTDDGKTWHIHVTGTIRRSEEEAGAPSGNGAPEP